MIAPLWRFRSFIAGMVATEFRNRYAGSLLGALWALLAPALLIAVYMVVFSQIMRGRLPTATTGDGIDFALFLAIGIICWNAFSDIIGRCQQVFIENKALIKKATFPKQCLPAVIMISTALNFLIVFALLLAIMAALGRWPGPGVLLALPVTALLMTLGLGLGVVLGALNVFFRDIGQVVPVALTLGFWVTPIVYSRDILPDWAQGFITANPLTPVFEALQSLALKGSWQGWSALVPTLGLTLAAIVLAALLFRGLSPRMADAL